MNLEHIIKLNSDLKIMLNIPNSIQLDGPNFFTYISHLVKDLEFNLNFPYPEWFNFTIRAIFDSKFYEMNYKYFYDYHSISTFSGKSNYRICIFLDKKFLCR